MKRNTLNIRTYYVQLARSITQGEFGPHFALGKTAALALFVLFILAGWSAAPGYSQTGQPRTTVVDVPFDMMAPWYTPDGELEDEVRLRGTLHVTARTWAARPDHIDRYALHANAVDIYGTSETTGQRFRLTGSFGYDLRDPEVTFNPDGSFSVPMQPWKLHFFKVDPEPARLTSDLTGSTGATAAAVGPPPPLTVACQRVFAPDGSPTPSFYCGSMTFTYIETVTPSLYRVVVGSGDACVPGTTCVVPDGARLFNGENGDYNPPLFMQEKVYTGSSFNGVPLAAKSVRWHCKTGFQEAVVGTQFFSGGLWLGRCDPIYSAVEPIKVWAETIYRFYTTYAPTQQTQEVTLVVKEREFTFRMDSLGVNLPPVIHGITVRSVALVDYKCPIGTECELTDGDVLYNGAQGDYAATVSMELLASDPDGDTLSVEWFCKSGSTIYNITNQGAVNAQCSTTYNYPNPVEIYAKVSDGTHEVWFDPPRQFTFLERLN
jgi:hypothetical protein